MSEIRHYFFYAHINKVNGKVYVGETYQNPPSKRWMNGKNYLCCRYFNAAIQKYGWDNFQHIILEECDCDFDTVKEIENKWIDYYDSRNPNKGYNIAPGGYAGLSPLAIEKAEEWKAAHPEVMQERVKAMHKWQAEHPEEMLASRKINAYKASNARKKPVVCIETKQRFESASEAARQISNTTQSKISMVCLGQRNTCGGYHWRYANE